MITAIYSSSAVSPHIYYIQRFDTPNQFVYNFFSESHCIYSMKCSGHPGISQMESFLVEAFRGKAVVAYREPRITKARKASIWPEG